jgi:hypothetical protein
MLALELLAEKKIAEAAERGDLDGLPGAGRPLDLEEDPLVPEEMRMARLESRYFGKVLRKLAK